MVDILLSTYNGEKFLYELIDSLIGQTYTDWRILIRDDASKDNTVKLIENFAKKFPEKIFFFDDEKVNLGSTMSFSKLLSKSSADYIMFCDQDDVWLPFKIEKTLSQMQSEESLHKNQPLLVFTDLIEVDEELNVISESFIKSQNLFPEIVSNPKKLAALNVVAGCTIMLNKAALKFVLPFPSKNITHDQWIATNVSHFGKVVYYPFATILYRQHSSNSIGSNKIGIDYFLKKILSPIKQFKIYRDLIKFSKFKMNFISLLSYKILFTFKRLL